jgi:hypothetical protein
MPSSKGKPTDPKLREEVKESKSSIPVRIERHSADNAEVKNETNKDGSGKGQWSAWKVGPDSIAVLTVLTSRPPS